MEGHIQLHLGLEVGNPGNQDGYYSILYPISHYHHSSEEAWTTIGEEAVRVPLLPRNDAYWIYNVTGIDTIDHIDHQSQVVLVQGVLNS